ncbi:hypothetical protein [Dyella sp. Tek66A03]|uniref:hypothetical protein n=1 Tax=Dyella sp. Tek66A03 TaxID=3458298 RepID=UPI00403E8E01
MFKDSKLDKARRRLRPLLIGQMVQISLGTLLAFGGAVCWATSLHLPYWFVCGLLVHAYGLLLIAFAVRTLYLVQRIDYAAPVVLIQRRLSDVRAWRVRVEAPFHAVLGSFIWIPITGMLLSWTGLELWSPQFKRWVIASGLVSLAMASVMAIVVWLMRRAGKRQRMEDNAAGLSVQRAEAELAEIARFERE